MNIKMYKKTVYLLLLVFVTSTSCMKIDILSFPSDNSITEYKLDLYDGRTDMDLSNKYNIDKSLIYQFSVESKIEGESESTRIEALYIGDLSQISTDTVILYCHGQSDHMDFYWPRAKLLANCGWKNRFGVLMMDYRGYGLSEGKSSEKGLFSDVSACIDWLKEKGVDEKKLIMYGFSLGTVPATELAAYNNYLPYKLILESPMASTDNLTQESTIINMSASYISTLRFDNAEKIKDVHQPFLWLHGTDDDYLAISNGEIIFSNYNGEYKEAIRVEGAKHGTDGVPQTMGFDKYLDAVAKFIVR